MKLSHLIAQALWAASYDPLKIARHHRISLKLAERKRGATGHARELLGL